ncbi:cell division protein FtsQ/DivIB [Pararhodonellum marinum]|uniref:cell division protein FtsQ/DivIB n=1 Tax=Pararhodonellum marinum TaxID=2755358 RepID=UPI00188F19AD|nr:cell division protein [Pararhodonellum marinum]
MKGFKNFKIKKTFVFLLLSLVLLVFIGFVEKKAAERGFHSFEVFIKGFSDVYFVDEQDIFKILKTDFDHIQGNTVLSEIALDKIEHRVESHPFVKNAEVFKDLKGKVIIKVEQHQPVARITRPMAADGYISSEGIILPTSSKYTSRVLLIEGSKADELLAEDDLKVNHSDLMDLIEFINQNEFWKAQIASLEIDRKGNIWMHQQVGKQVIEFGKPEDIEQKFKKIEVFYQQILPQKGWNTYSKVNVKYKDQIICD